jgi:hypothetical protein
MPPQDAKNRAIASQMSTCNAVAVHVRWFDLPSAMTTLHNISADYYRRAIDVINRSISNPHFFLFSDDPNSARSLLGLSAGCLTCVDHNRGNENAYADLWLMTHCKHFIIANSTFSWWGAWLSLYKGKIVVAPDIVQSGISSWGFKGLVPEEWAII